LSTAEPKWVPYLRANNILADIPPEGLSSNAMTRNPEMLPVCGGGPNEYEDDDQPVVRRIASDPVQYQKSNSREHSSHVRSSKSSAKRRPKAESARNKTPPRVKGNVNFICNLYISSTYFIVNSGDFFSASVSTISWREELIHYKSSHPQSPQKNRPVSKPSDLKSEGILNSKDSVKVAAPLKNGNNLKTSTSSNIVNGKKSTRSVEAIAAFSNTASNGPQNSNSNHLIPQSKTEIEDGRLNHLMESITAVKKLVNVTRSHVDVTAKGSVMQSKKRSSSENNLTTQKNDKHKLVGHRASSLSGEFCAVGFYCYIGLR